MVGVLLEMRRIAPQSRFLLLFALWTGWSQLAKAQSLAVSALPLPEANDIVWNAACTRFFVGSGTNVLIVNPETAQIEGKIYVGTETTRIAVSDDGRYLYAALDGLGIISRYRIQDHFLEAQIALGLYTGGNTPRNVQEMIVLPGQPLSLLVASKDRRVVVFDGTVQRGGAAALAVTSLYVRPSDGSIFGIASDASYPEVHTQMYSFTVGSAGIDIAKAVPLSSNWNNATNVTWNRSLVVSRNPFSSYLFDLNAGATIGRLPLSPPSGESGACFLAADASGTSAFAYQHQYQSSINRLVQYSLPNLRPIASVDLTGIPRDAVSLADLCGSATSWGTDGIVIKGRGKLYFLHSSGLIPLAKPPVPAPTRDTSGVIHLPLPANGLVFDAGRNLLWASIPGSSAIGNTVVSIDPGTGNVIDTIDAGSEPGALALASDGSHLFAALAGAPAIASIDLTAKLASAFSVLDPSNSPYWTAIGLAAVSGQGESVVAVRSAGRTSVVAYDAGVARQNMFNNGSGETQYDQYVQTIFPADTANTFYAVDTYLHAADGTHGVYRLVLDLAGLRPDTQLNNLLVGSTSYNQPVSLVYQAGRLFTSAGQIFTPDTKHILGSVSLMPSYGLPVPFPDQNGVVYVQSGSLQVSAIYYDLGTLRPFASSLLFTGSLSAVNVIAAVRVASNAVAVSANGEIVIAPLTRFQSWPSTNGLTQTVAPGVRQINIPINAISVLPGTSKLLLATPSRAGRMGNSIVTFNSDTNQFESAAFIGSEPSLLAAAPDGLSVYAYLSGEYNLARFNVATGSRDLVFDADPTGGSDQEYGVFDMAMGPDGGLAVSSQNAFVGLLGGFDRIRPGQFMGIFDNGVPRPQIDANANLPAALQLAFNDSGSRLYGYNSFLSSFELIREEVSAKGLQLLSSTPGLISGYGTQIRAAGGLVYTSNGQVIDPEKLVRVG